MKKKGILLLILLITLITFVNAENSLRFTAKQNTLLDVTERCQASGFPCGSEFNCNITIENPDQKIIILNENMTRNETIYNYTLIQSQTQSIGIYQCDVCCRNSTDGGCNTFWFEITPSGRQLGTTSAIVYTIILIASILIFIFCLYGSFKIPWRNPRNTNGFIEQINYLKHFKISLAFISYLLLIWILNILITITNNFLFLTISFSFFKALYFILLSALFPIIILIIYLIILNIINDKKIKRFMSRGLNIK